MPLSAQSTSAARTREMTSRTIASTAHVVETMPEVPFYVAATGPTGRPRRTLKHDNSFLVLDAHGEIGASPEGSDGLFCDDTRFLSRFEVRINDVAAAAARLQCPPRQRGAQRRPDQSRYPARRADHSEKTAAHRPDQRHFEEACISAARSAITGPAPSTSPLFVSTAILATFSRCAARGGRGAGEEAPPFTRRTRHVHL